MNNESERQNKIDKIEHFNLRKCEETKKNNKKLIFLFFFFRIIIIKKKQRSWHIASQVNTYVDIIIIIFIIIIILTLPTYSPAHFRREAIRRESSSHLGVTFLLSFSFQWKKKNKK
jgi:ABC-type multidrug transport system permease subunit